MVRLCIAFQLHKNPGTGKKVCGGGGGWWWWVVVGGVGGVLELEQAEQLYCSVLCIVKHPWWLKLSGSPIVYHISFLSH